MADQRFIVIAPLYSPRTRNTTPIAVPSFRVPLNFARIASTSSRTFSRRDQ
jgi:hypothetical protein